MADLKVEYELTAADYREGYREYWRRIDAKQHGGLPFWIYGAFAALIGGFLQYVQYTTPMRSGPAWAQFLLVLLTAGVFGTGTYLAIVGPIARARASRRTYERSVARDSLRFMLLADRDGFHFTTARELGTIAWRSFVPEMGETKNLLVLHFLGGMEFMIIPKRAFADGDDLRGFLRLFERGVLRPTSDGTLAASAAIPVRAIRALPFMVIDAFARHPFTGNPAAVVWLDDDLHDAARQSLAMEFNQAETAFVRSLPDGRFELRWFTPAREVPLCGHATLASAAALRVWGTISGAEPIRFVTRHSGELVCRFDGGDDIAMDLPATPPQPTALPANAAEVLRIPGPVECVGTTTMNLTLRVPSAEQVRAAAPDLARLAGWHAVGVTLTAPGDGPGVDFVSRFFAPNCGIPEDPVTGSAHCALARYWAAQLRKTEFTARQLSPRGGDLRVKLLGNRVELRGGAVAVMRGTIEI